jgi:16S rRNA (cytosine967-C5)-methyltransferase
MTPSARLQAAQGLLSDFLKSARPLDGALKTYFKANRYAGSSDRRAIQETVYATVRSLEELKWRLGQAGGEVSGRNLLLAHLVKENTFDAALFGHPPYGLETLSEGEGEMAERLKRISAGPPEHAALNMPPWLFEKFTAQFPESYREILSALNGRAPVSLRVNSLKSTPENLSAALKEKGVGVSPGAFATNALRLAETIPFQNLPGFKEGWFEAQDEGSQLGALAVDAKPGMQVLDLCAGAGGKALAMAAAMENKGQIFAFDADAGRLDTLRKRAERAGARIIQASRIPEGEGREKVLAPFQGKMDRVVLDVPCSGTGSLRRAPDLRFRLNPEWLATHVARQAALLREGAELVKPGGSLTYVTCSLLDEENEAQIKAFLGENQAFQALDVAEILAAAGAPTLPPNQAGLEGALLMTPDKGNTDGFFICVLKKKT